MKAETRAQTSASRDDVDNIPLLAANASVANVAYGSLRASDKSPKVNVGLPSIIWRLFLMFKTDIIASMIIKCVSDLLLFANPQLLR